MKKGAVIWTIIILIILVLIIWWIYQANSGSQTVQLYPTSTPGTSGTPTSTPTGPTFDQNLSDGTITINYPSADFGLATNSKQILVSAVIPPCSGTFNYCLYFDNTSTYAGTNFESAGIRIQKRPGLATQSLCLNTQPSGYTNLKPTIATSTDYAVSVFPQIGGGAAGSIAAGSLYRLAYNRTCYEIETRLGMSQFANYPSGTIQEFTSADQTTLQGELQSILSTLTIASSGEQVVFP
jgi:hypothetical protein